MRHLPLLTTLCLLLSPFARAATAPPNILLILSDDLGYGDIAAFNPNSKIPTPNVDALAKAGMRFTDAHAPGAVCVPSRYGLLTGRYPFRNERNANKQALIEPDRPTIATILKQAGYTTAMVGKWHESFDNGTAFDYAKPLRGGPVDRGFDSFFGMHASLDIPPYFYIDNDHPTMPPTGHTEDHHSPDTSPIQGKFWRAGPIAPDFKHEEVLDKFTARCVDFLSKQKGATKPFFLYFAPPSPHTPWVPSSKWANKSGVGPYGDYVMQVDDAVGQLLAALDAAGHTNDTLVFFTSDNGPVWYAEDIQRYHHDSAAGLRGMKGDAWEAGHRMPFIARWPGHIAPSSTSTQTLCFTDFFATFASLTAQPLPALGGEDSFDLTPCFTGKPSARDSLIVESSAGKVLAVRQAQWKLIPQLGSCGFTKPSKIKPGPNDPPGQLYDLSTDLAETKNVYADHPDVVKRLTEIVEKAKKEGHTRRDH